MEKICVEGKIIGTNLGDVKVNAKIELPEITKEQTDKIEGGQHFLIEGIATEVFTTDENGKNLNWSYAKQNASDYIDRLKSSIVYIFPKKAKQENKLDEKLEELRFNVIDKDYDYGKITASHSDMRNVMKRFDKLIDVIKQLNIPTAYKDLK